MNSNVVCAFFYFINFMHLRDVVEAIEQAAGDTKDDCRCEIDFNIIGRKSLFPVVLDTLLNKVVHPEPGESVAYLPSGKIVEFHCTSNYGIFYGNHTKLSKTYGPMMVVQCLYKTKFVAMGDEFDILDVHCNMEVMPAIRISRQFFDNSTKKIQIGVRLVDAHYLPQYSVYFDYKLQITKYSQSQVICYFNPTPGVYTNKLNGSEEGKTIIRKEIFSTIEPIERIYTLLYIRQAFNKQLGRPTKSTKELAENRKLTIIKGFLSPAGDYAYGYERDSTHFYLNVVPMWKSLHVYGWKWVENFVRRYSYEKKVNLTVLTGIQGILHLTHSETFESIPMYMIITQNGEIKQIPVPNWLWKVVYDEKNQAGIAFVGRNNPFKQEERVLCPDISGYFDWYEVPRRNGQVRLHICTINDLRVSVPEIPEFNVLQFLKFDTTAPYKNIDSSESLESSDSFESSESSESSEAPEVEEEKDSDGEY